MIYYVTFGVILCSAIGAFIIYLLEKKRHQALKTKIIETCSKYGNIEDKDGKQIFVFKDLKVEILTFVLKHDEELVINSRVMWEVFKSSKAMLYDQTEFLKSEFDKWIIIYPSTHKIKRYINENEMVFVKYDEPIYDYQLISYLELENYLEDIKHGI